METITEKTQAIGSNAGAPESNNHQSVFPIEFITSADARRVFGIVKSQLYALKEDGKIRSVCLRKRNAARGKRLWVADSIRSFLNSQMEGENI